MKTSTTPPRAVLLACSFAFIIVQLDVTIVNVALPQMGRELDASVAGLQWVVDAYTLGFAVFLLSAGVLGDKFGARRVFLAGFALFTAASLACAAAPDALLLNIARAVQGIGAALLVPSSLSILNAAYAHDKALLAKAVGWWTAAGGVSIAAGPVLGAALLELAGWRSIFWVNVPLCVAGYWLTLRAVPAAAGKDPKRAFDLPGQVLAVVALAAFIGAVIEVHALGWSHAAVRSGLAVAAVSGALFLLVESRSKAPMLPLALFRSAGFSGAVAFGVMVNFAYYGVIFVLSFYLQSVRGYTAMEAGMIFLPLTGTFIFSNIASGWVAARTGLRAPMIIGGLVGASGYGLLCVFGISQQAGFWAMLPGLALIPAGTASAVLNTARQVGGALGVAVYGAMAAAATPALVTAGVRGALMVSAALLLCAAAAAWLCVAAPRRIAATA